MSKHIVLATSGSFGDVFPFIALALELHARGHRAVIATSEIFRQMIESEGIEFCAIRPDGYINVEQVGQFIQLLSESQQVLDYGISYLTMPHLRATYYDLMEAAREADLLVTHPLACPASLVAEKTGIPRISTILSPISFLSAYDCVSGSAIPTSAYEKALTLVARDNYYRKVRWQAGFWSAPVRQLRADNGLEPSSDILFEGQHSSELVLALFSQVLATPQPDWPTQTQVTGFPFLASRNDKGLPKVLILYLGLLGLLLNLLVALVIDLKNLQELLL